MRIMLVADKPDLEAWIRSLVNENEHFVVHYQHPLKALDNLGEVRPHLIIWDHNDFPRHWKICAAWCRDEKDMEESRLVLVSETPLSEDERTKISAFPRLTLVEADYFSDSFTNLIKESVQTQQSVSQRKPVQTGRFKKVGILHPVLYHIIIGIVIDQHDNCITVSFDEADQKAFRDQKDQIIYDKVRGTEKNSASWLKLQLLEETPEHTFVFVCLKSDLVS